MNHAFLLILISVLTTGLFAILIAKWFRQPENAPQTRSRQLDGLRGVLACCVIAHHSYYNYTWREGGVWGAKSMMIVNLGAVAVSLFFMLSAYFHVIKMRKSPEMNWREFYLSRIKRIYPLYLAVFALVLLITLSFRPMDFVDLMKFIGQWLLFQNASYQGFQSHLIIAGVQWTLVYEWAVYLILPLIHMIYHRKIIRQPEAWFAILLGIWVMYYHTKMLYLWIFLLAIPAALLGRYIVMILQRFPRSSLIFMILLTMYIFAYTHAYSWEQRVCLAVLFACLANGFSYANLLNHQGLVKLGDWSYAIYLLHGMVLFMWFGVWRGFDFGHGDFVAYAWHLPMVFAVAFGLAYLGNRYVEQPFWRR